MIHMRSLTARLATLFAALTACLLVLAAVLFGRMLDAHFQELDAHELHGKLTLIRNALEDARTGAGPSTRFEVLDRSFVGHESVGVLVRAVDGGVLHVIHPEHFTPAQQAGARLAGAAAEWTVDGRPHRGQEVRIDLPATAANDKAIDVLVATTVAEATAGTAAAVSAADTGGVGVAAAAALASPAD